MMKIYLINLEESRHRRELMECQLRQLQLDYEIVPAVNGHRLGESDIATLCVVESVRRYPDWLTPGAIGAALSHRDALRRLAEEDRRCGLILEDDIILPSNLPAILDQLESSCREDELILLYWLSDEVQPFQKESAVMIDQRHRLAISNRPQSLLSAVGYVVGRSVARRIIEINTPVRMTPDLWAGFLAGGAMTQIRCVVPSPIRLANLPSDIGYGRQHFLRRIKRWLEIRLPLFQRLSARRRKEYFSKRQKYTWV